MNIIRLTHNDLNEMITSAVHSLLRETMGEMILYHGSPKKFRRFRNKKLETYVCGYGTYLTIIEAEGRYYAKKNGYLYEVEIPDDNGRNYIISDHATPETYKIVYNTLVKKFPDDELAIYDAIEHSKECGNLVGIFNSKGIENTDITPKEITETFRKCGYVGLKDHNYYVIFSPKNLKIKKRTQLSDETDSSSIDESVSEAMGSIVADKEDVIEEIVDDVEKRWENIIQNNESPDSTGFFHIKSMGSDKRPYETYKFDVSEEITRKLDIAEHFTIAIVVENYHFSPEDVDKIPKATRYSTGVSYSSDKYGIYSKTKMRVVNGLIKITIPAINDELQTRGFTTALYHELNHNLSTLKAKIKKHDKYKDWEISRMNFRTLTRRQRNNPRYMVHREMEPDKVKEKWQRATYREYMDAYNAMNWIFYGLWETTERNARAEEIYGDLKRMDSKRENFKEDYKKTRLYKYVNEFEGLLEQVKEIPTSWGGFGGGKLPTLAPRAWLYAARVMNMNPRGRGGKYDSKGNREPEEKFLEEVKKRFIKRTEELIEKLYRKGIKVAEYYFQKHEPKKEPSRLERYKQEHNK